MPIFIPARAEDARVHLPRCLILAFDYFHGAPVSDFRYFVSPLFSIRHFFSSRRRASAAMLERHVYARALIN